MKNQGMKTGVVYQHPIGYLVIGHVTQNLQLTAHASWVGGTASFVGSMALALGLRVGIVTSAGPEADLSSAGRHGSRLPRSGWPRSVYTCFQQV